MDTIHHWAVTKYREYVARHLKLWHEACERYLRSQDWRQTISLQRDRITMLDARDETLPVWAIGQDVAKTETLLRQAEEVFGRDEVEAEREKELFNIPEIARMAPLRSSLRGVHAILKLTRPKSVGADARWKVHKDSGRKGLSRFHHGHELECHLSSCREDHYLAVKLVGHMGRVCNRPHFYKTIATSLVRSPRRRS